MSSIDIRDQERGLCVYDFTLISGSSGEDATQALPSGIAGKIVQLTTQPQTLTDNWDLTLVGSDTVGAAGSVFAAPPQCCTAAPEHPGDVLDAP